MLTDANTPKKCRALFGLDRQTLWCKPCRYIPYCKAFGKNQSILSFWYLSASIYFDLIPIYFPAGIND